MISTINTPQVNTNDDQVQVLKWHVDNGAYVEAGQAIVDIETSKTVMTVEAEADGYVDQLLPEDAIVSVGDPLYRIASTAAELGNEQNNNPDNQSGKPTEGVESVDNRTSSETLRVTRFSRHAERLLQARGLSKDDFNGLGLVSCRVIEARLGHQVLPDNKPKTVANVSPSMPQTLLSAPYASRSERVSLAKLAEIQSLSTGENGNINSMLSIHFDSAAIRGRLNQDRLFDGNILPLIIFEISRLLRQWPQFTAYFDDNRIHYYDRVNIGIAIDLGHGLKVVALHDTDTLMPMAIFEKILDAGMRYMENRIRSEELTYSTFTVTDLSGFDVLHFHPLINGRQSAIIGIGGDSRQNGYPMSINMTFDHRVTNGREVGQFLKELRDRLLAYAAPVPEMAIQSSSVRMATPAGLAVQIGFCDICGIERESYYRNYGKWAFLLAYAREDGSIGGACHRCVNGTI